MRALLWIGLVVFCSGVVYAGHFTVTPDERIEKLAGENVTLPCSFQLEGERLLNKGWLWKGKEITYNDLIMGAHGNITIELDESEGRYNLVLFNVQPSNEGKYTCKFLLTPGGPNSVDTELRVNVPPYDIEVADERVQKEPGDSLSLACSASGKPPPTITWTRKEDTLPSGDGSVAQEVLNVPSLTKTDGGVYVCMAANGFGETQQAEVVVEVSYEPEVHAPTDVIFSGPKHTNVELVCVFDAYPRVNIQWLVNGTDVTSLPHMYASSTIDKNIETFKLAIELVQSDDLEKEYECVGTNTFGVDAAVITLKGVPMQVEIISPELSSFGDKYNIRWNVSSYSRPLEYHLSFWTEVNSTRNEFAFAVPSTPVDDLYAEPSEGLKYEQEYLLQGLIPETKYEAQISARNGFGVGETSEVFMFTTNKAGATPPPPTTTTAATTLPDKDIAGGDGTTEPSADIEAPVVSGQNASVYEIDPKPGMDDDESGEDGDDEEEPGDIDSDEEDSKPEESKTGEVGSDPRGASTLLLPSVAMVTICALLSARL